MPEVVVIGGGATGTGVARDLAMRGVTVVLIERGSLAQGTTGHTHGVLHSGGRYAVSDPASARDCIAENRILRDIAPHCISPSGGLFVQLPGDSADYFSTKVAACHDCGIPVEHLDTAQIRNRDPALTDTVERAFAVPDGVIDPFQLCAANAAAAESHGARIETHTEVKDMIVEEGRVCGVTVHPAGGSAGQSFVAPGGSDIIRADYVVNATGPWVGQVANLAGVDVPVRYSKGAMAEMRVDGVSRVLNRSRPKSEGDIIVPRDSRVVLGTTDREIANPDSFSEDASEITFLVNELAALLPALHDARVARSYWGVRTLVHPSEGSPQSAIDLSRDFAIIDHAARDGLAGFSSIVGGKLTTYRLMAEHAADLVCSTLGVEGESQTDRRPLPGRDDVSEIRRYLETTDSGSGGNS